jgi:ABC-2 type transport system permease protein
MHKTYLVAMREFVENLRTKTFWIGVLAFPLIFALAMVLGRVLHSAKDVRTYAVLDHTEGQWLSAEVHERAEQSDLHKIQEQAKNDPAGLQAQIERLPPDHVVRKILERLDERMRNASPEEREKLEHGNPISIFEVVGPELEKARRDPEAQKQLLSFAKNLSMSKYRLVEVGDLGGDPEAALNKRLQDGSLFAYFVIGEDPIAGSQGCRYVSNNVTDDDLRDWYSSLATQVVQERRIAKLQRERGITEAEARLLNAPLRFDEQKVSETGKTEEVTGKDKGFQFAPVAFVYLLWIAVFTAAQMLLTNTIEEKSNRILEVLLSSVSPLQLMTGKVLGIAATGLTVVGSWVLCAIIGVKLLPTLMPGVPLDELGLVGIIGDPRYLGSFVGYFLAGYFLFAALLVGIGSVCNSLKEAQNLQQPIVILLIVPLIAMFPVMKDPNGTLAKVLTYIPPFTPFLMMNRAGGPPAAWEYVATTILLAVSILIAFWAAAKIFRIGILMTGKPPKLREILGWLRAPVGAVPVRDEPK